MFLESGNGPFRSIDLVVVGGDKLNVHPVGTDVFFYGLGTFVVHDVEGRLIVSHPEYGEDLGEGSNHGGVSAGRHWSDNDGVEVIDICHKDVLHVLEGPDGEGLGEVSVRCAYGAYLLGGWHAVDVCAGGHNVGVGVAG